VYFQKSNTGYFGNFRKCRELSNGKYLWLLSDNDHIFFNTIDKILNVLFTNKEIGLIFLNNNSNIKTEYLSANRLIRKYNYKLTLLSSCVMFNIKSEDGYLFKKYDSNTFLGFIFVLNGKKYNTEAAIINGRIYKSMPAKVSFNIFQTWTTDIFECLFFARTNMILNDDLIYIIKENILKKVLKVHLLNYKIYRELLGRKYGSFNEIFNKLKDYYGALKCFNEVTDYIYKTPRIILFTQVYLKKVLRKITKIFEYTKYVFK